jgi:hypothetical protein
MPSDTLFVHIYYGDNKNIFEHYEDDGSTMDYLKGAFFKRFITFDPVKKQVVFSPAEGSYSSSYKIIKCILHGFEGVTEMKVNGDTILLNFQIAKLLDGLRFLEDIYDPAYYMSLKTKEKNLMKLCFIFPNLSRDITITWK